MNLAFMSATGNRFALVDGFAGDWPSDPAVAARELCTGAPKGAPGTGAALHGSRGLDGLLLIGPPRSSGDCVMEIWNADGGRAEMCGNGLRCVGRFMLERGYARGSELTVETDAGPRSIKVLRKPRGEWAARAEVGVPRLTAARLSLPGQHGLPEEFDVVEVDLGNPHCVIFVADERTAPVEHVGALLQSHARFPRGTNVEFAAPDGHRLGLRVYERGVGETASCGSGACAAAAAAISQGRVESPVEVQQSGGWLLVEWDQRGSTWLTGPVEDLHGDPASAPGGQGEGA